MYNDVIDNLHRQHDDPPVKPETLPAAATAPQRLLVPDLNIPVIEAGQRMLRILSASRNLYTIELQLHFSSVIGRSAAYDLCGTFFIVAHDTVAQKSRIHIFSADGENPAALRLPIHVKVGLLALREIPHPQLQIQMSQKRELLTIVVADMPIFKLQRDRKSLMVPVLHPLIPLTDTVRIDSDILLHHLTAHAKRRHHSDGQIIIHHKTDTSVVHAYDIDIEDFRPVLYLQMCHPPLLSVPPGKLLLFCSITLFFAVFNTFGECNHYLIFI